MALITLLHAVLAKMKASITVKDSTHEAWESIQRLWVGADRVKSGRLM
jgi:hypothetical protein